eukprot:scaffold71554_cov29-Prasinocladus_malaysianus.AAC.1
MTISSSDITFDVAGLDDELADSALFSANDLPSPRRPSYGTEEIISTNAPTTTPSSQIQPRRLSHQQKSSHGKDAAALYTAVSLNSVELAVRCDGASEAPRDSTSTDTGQSPVPPEQRHLNDQVGILSELRYRIRNLYWENIIGKKNNGIALS